MELDQECASPLDANTGSQQDTEQPGVPSDPTKDTYEELNRAYEFFNERLFESKLPKCMITLRAKGMVLGYYSRKRFVHPDGRISAEIALNPEASAYRSVVQCLSTLVHEQVHLYQDHLGLSPRRGYHDTWFANEMQRIGLQTTDTGYPGGRTVGQKMTHYIIPGGPFELAARDLLSGGFKAVWFDAFISIVDYGYNANDPDPATKPVKPADKGSAIERASRTMTNLAAIEKLRKRDWQDGDKPAILDNLDKIHLRQPKKSDASKTKFRCTKCGAQAWAKDTILLKCGACDLKMYGPHEFEQAIRKPNDPSSTLGLEPEVDHRQLNLLPQDEDRDDD